MSGFRETAVGLVPSEDIYKDEHRKRKYILKYLIRCSSLMEACQFTLNKMKFFEGFPDLDFIWGTVSGYWSEYSKLAPEDAILLDLELKYDAECPFSLADIKQTVGKWFAEKDLDSLHVQNMLQGYLKEYALTTLKQKLDSDPDSLDSAELQNFAERMRPALLEPTQRNPFVGSPNLFLEQNKRIPIGIDFIDALLDGGTIPGEVVGFVIPSGGGKTTLVMQGTAAAIIQKKHVLILSFEQKLEGDITGRMYVLASNSRRMDWKKGDITKINAAVMERWRQAQPLWAKYLHFYDNWVSAEFPLHSVKEMFTVIDKLAAIGQKPEILWIDWWGRMCGKLETAQMALKSDYDKRKAHQTWLHEIKSYSEEYGVRTFLMHQLAGAQAAKSSRFLASAHDAMENKNFPQMLDYCFVASKKDNMGRVQFKLDKARSTKGDTVTAYLNGEYCKFESTAPEYTSSLLVDEIGENEDYDE